MRRQRWFELHDQPWFPAALRDLVTEALEAVWNVNRTYHPIARRLREAVQRSGADRIVDLCSGGGGPWLGLYDEVAGGQELHVCLTDLYPNAPGLARAVERQRGVTASLEPVDARSVPAELRGFRTMFSSFHHFDPEAARAMLADAFHRREGIAVFEAARRNATTLAAVSAVPLLALRAAATEPFRWRRVLWTYCIPMVPLVLWVDGVLSCLRSYSEEELRELTRDFTADDYLWQIGEERSGLVTIRYLIGTPLPPGGYGMAPN